MQHASTAELIRHISRIEGQLASVKKELQRANPDCSKASDTLSATSRSFSSLRRAFMQCFLDKYASPPKTGSASRAAYDSLMRVVNS